MSRFSRGGESGIAVVHQLIDVQGVHLIETQSGLSTFLPKDRNEMLSRMVQAQRENIERLEITKPGMQRFLRNGNWLGTVPKGYDRFGPRVKDRAFYAPLQSIVLNGTGTLLKEAWSWKLKGQKDFQILQALQLRGLKMSKQQLSAMWRKPFYCGVSINKMLEGEIVRGNWESMISESEFFRVQEIFDGRQKYTVGENDVRAPLKGTALCPECGGKMTSDFKKQRVYYKCQNSCPKTNMAAAQTSRSPGLHEFFEEVIGLHKLKDKHVAAFKAQLARLLKVAIDETLKAELTLKKRLSTLEEVYEILDKRNAFGKLSDEKLEKFGTPIFKQIQMLQGEIKKVQVKISNSGEVVERCIEVGRNICCYWEKGSYEVRQQLQELLFPSGIKLDPKKRTYRTQKLNVIFACIAELTTGKGEKKEDKPGINLICPLL